MNSEPTADDGGASAAPARETPDYFSWYNDGHEYRYYPARYTLASQQPPLSIEDLTEGVKTQGLVVRNWPWRSQRTHRAADPETGENGQIGLTVFLDRVADVQKPGGDVQPRLFSDDVMRALHYEISHRVEEAESGVLDNIADTDEEALARIIGEAYRSVSGIEAPLESVPENFKMNEEGTHVNLRVSDSNLSQLVLVNTLSRPYAPTELEKAVAEQIIKGSLSQIIWDTLVRDDQPPGDSVDPTRNFYGHPASRYMEDGTVSPEALYQMSKKHGFPCSIDARIPDISLSRAKWAYALLDEEGNLPTDESAYTADPVALRQQAESSKSKMGARVTLDPTLCLWDPHITLKEGEDPPPPFVGRLNTFSTSLGS